MTVPDRSPLRRKDKIVAIACGLGVAFMVGASYAAVPFYNWFCRATGYNGTTQVATAAPTGIVDHKITIRLDANTGPGLPWRFTPERDQIEVKLGQVVTVYYHVINQAARTITAQAAYNVSPLNAGAYFDKINCFCFTEQTMKPGETRDMAVVFYVDPAMLKDADAKGNNTITLSYTFYQQREPSRPVAEGSSGQKTIY